MQFSQLLLPYTLLPSAYDCTITGLALDSRVVQAGNLFIALAGTQTHGEIYIPKALQQGAIAILKEGKTVEVTLLANATPCVTMPDLSERLGEIVATFYGHPTQDMQVIGVTGTNGKTSITHFIAQVLNNYAPCGLLGTLGYGTYGQLHSGLHTTPDAIHLQALFAQLRSQQVKTVAMEVSSHALAQGRVNGTRFNTAVFSNLSRDHLDYHQTMEAYAAAKQRLFHWPQLKTAVINQDDEFGQTLLQHLPTSVTALTYSLQNTQSDVYARIVEKNLQGCQLVVHTPWGQGQLHSPLLGQFNVSNLLAALTVLLNHGLRFSEVVQQLHEVRAVAGRMERFGQLQQPTIIVDYAHTPDALEKTLLAIREHCPLNQMTQLWCIFGCGGNRDRGKRSLMGEIAKHYADQVIITDDNPRRETSQNIIQDILQGIQDTHSVTVISNREQAILHALQRAAIQDVILIAGKGHEDYQEIADVRWPFSDRKLVVDYLSKYGI